MVKMITCVKLNNPVDSKSEMMLFCFSSPFLLPASSSN